MAQVELIMPKMGESVAEATVIKWLKNVGETIEMDESVLEIATDKVDSEVPSAVEGVLIKQLFNEDDIVLVGQAVAIIETDASAAGSSAPKASKETPKEVAVAEEIVEKAMEKTTLPKSSDSNKFFSPLVRSIAQEEGMSMTELESVAGSGKDGRITKKDILAYLTNRSSAPAAAPAPKASKPAASTATVAAISAPKVPAMEGDEIIEMDRMRKMIANHMVMSKHVSPHVTSFVEADVTNIVNWRNKVKDEFFKREGEKITFTPIFVDAVVKAIKDFPMINVAVDGTNIIKRKHINVGMAAALPSGNLIVPVIKDADQKNMIGLTKAVNDLARRSRSNDLKPDEVSGGTFTLTNVGGFGNIMGTPIINQPQVAIMAVGAIVKKPAVIETDMGDVIAIRHKMFCSLSYDHRVVDGSLGGMFLKRFSDYLEAFDPNTSI
ncbi:MAG: 2-oxoglutarate dehydrogenase E2 component (dihydrolipoamide succinyltransferase) [Flavobacteriales bacterium]|jgi:2-oxoglutarate dehydrogenase E2 component (dihydrolipoamide succinyltransferase)|tara:strand:+ start:800 stop:2110 length:1311 start_codon:yes stop_codon:yes gene_type:complete